MDQQAMEKIAASIVYLQQNYFEPMFWSALAKRGVVPRNDVERDAIVKIAQATGAVLAYLDSAGSTLEKQASTAAMGDPTAVEAVLTLAQLG